jgi:hypothetical protein
MSDDEKVVYTIDFDLPGTAKGQSVQVAGLGEFENGSSYDVTREEADAFRSYNIRQESHHNEDGQLVTETHLGPTLLQAFEHTEGVTVTTTQPNQQRNDPPKKPEGEGDDKKGGDE